MSSVLVKRIEPTMLGSLSALEAECFSHPWSSESLELLCSESAVGFAVLDENDRVLAYAGMLTVLDEGQITNVAVLSEARRRGYASAVLSALLEFGATNGISSFSLEVRRGNLAAISLYEKHGFAVVGERKRFYADPVEDALVMVKQL